MIRLQFAPPRSERVVGRWGGGPRGNCSFSGGMMHIAAPRPPPPSCSQCVTQTVEIQTFPIHNIIVSDTPILVGRSLNHCSDAQVNKFATHSQPRALQFSPFDAHTHSQPREIPLAVKRPYSLIINLPNEPLCLTRLFLYRLRLSARHPWAARFIHTCTTFVHAFLHVDFDDA